MPNVARIGDIIYHPPFYFGAITEGSADVLTNGIGTARIGDAAVCMIHGQTTIATGSGSVNANGIGVARVGDTCACGAVILTGSPNVNAGG